MAYEVMAYIGVCVHICIYAYAGTGDDLPPGWKMSWDSATNKYYYENPTLGETQWEKPSPVRV